MKAEQEEEFISNTLFKKIQELKKEKETLANNYEREEEFLTNDLSRKLQHIRDEKYSLEQSLEKEQASQMSQLMKRIQRLEAETINKENTLVLSIACLRHSSESRSFYSGTTEKGEDRIREHTGERTRIVGQSSLEENGQIGNRQNSSSIETSKTRSIERKHPFRSSAKDHQWRRIHRLVGMC